MSNILMAFFAETIWMKEVHMDLRRDCTRPGKRDLVNVTD